MRYDDGADWRRLDAVINWRMHRSEGLYILPGNESFFLMQRMADGTVECLDRVSLTDVEAEGLDLRVA